MLSEAEHALEGMLLPWVLIQKKRLHAFAKENPEQVNNFSAESNSNFNDSVKAL